MNKYLKIGFVHIKGIIQNNDFNLFTQKEKKNSTIHNQMNHKSSIKLKHIVVLNSIFIFMQKQF